MTCLKMKCSFYKRCEVLEEELKCPFISIEIVQEDKTREEIEVSLIFITFKLQTTGLQNEETLFHN